jgi:hypothetical protein
LKTRSIGLRIRPHTSTLTLMSVLRTSVLLLDEHNVRGLGRGHMLGEAVAELRQLQPREKMLAGAEQDRRDGQVQLVDEPF